MKIIWNGHACFTLETAEGTAVFDPYSPNTVPGFTLPELTADAVFCSHGHGDHNYSEGVKLSGKEPSFKVKQIPSFHDDCSGEKRGSNLITVICAEGLTVAHFGDLGHQLSAEQLQEIGSVDIMLVPVGGFFTINAAEAKQACDAVGAKVIIPMHYRGKGFGYDKIGTVEPFVDLFDIKMITRLPSYVLELSSADEKRVIVFG